MTYQKRICDRAELDGNTDTGFLKLIAIITMIIDHVGAAFFPAVYELRVIGRIAFPLYLWCVVVGCVYTRNHWKYALRFAALAVITQPFYMFALNHSLLEFNVMVTLLCGLLGIIAIRENKFGSRIWGPILALLLSCAFHMDYGWEGVALMLLMYLSRGDRRALGALMTAYCLYWGQGTIGLTSLFGIVLPRELPWLSYSSSLLSVLYRIQFFAILSLPFMLWRKKGERLKLPKWLGYAAYPAHLAVIGLIRNFGAISEWFTKLF